MTTPRKTYSATFKAQLVQELLKEEQTLPQIAAKAGVHPNQLRRWKEKALTAMPANFEDEERLQKWVAAKEAEYEAEKEKLYAQIGKLSTELAWLKKKYEGTSSQTRPFAASRTPKSRNSTESAG